MGRTEVGEQRSYFRLRWYERYLTTISTELGFLWDFVLLKLKTCSLYHENLFIQKFKVISKQVLNNFLSASDIMKAVRGRFHFYGMNAIQLLFLLSLDFCGTLIFL